MRVREYLTAEGRSPFRDWLDTLDMGTRARVQARVLRFEVGNLGDHKPVAVGVREARLAFGAGYRIYFGKQPGGIILLLLGGDKRSQKEDIRRAIRLWREYLERMKHG